MTETKKRDFVSQIISLVEEEEAVLTEKGFDPAIRLDALKIKKTGADQAETAQQEAAAKAMEATTHSNLTLDDAYKEPPTSPTCFRAYWAKKMSW